ncbi:C3a anaphylatoxin chemotactic receptor-like [Varanus komodoensis]|uniref:C3a anaphylatoxin chemotactic receptor n=1 Tax=Varanus komodoensis TaxID=61221 RepID=A0A8D2L130_VARKO|nr:C3a anaphylatoxin chemotactic receptor-like [Varanus komodoensis]
MSSLLANNSLNGCVDPFILKHTSTLISCLAVLSLTFLLGLPGNGLVIWVTTLKMERTVNTIWFLNLAVADFLCCLSLPFHIGHLALLEHWPYGWFFCKIIPATIIFNMFASVFLLTIISIDRCLVVMKPVWCQNHRTVRLTSKICGGIWLLAFFMCFPAFFFREIYVDEFGNTRCINRYGDEDYAEDNWSFDSFYSNNVTFTPYPTFMVNGMYDTYSESQPPNALLSITVTRSVIGFLLPLGIMVTCYVLIAHKMLKKQFSKSFRKILRMILLVIGTFFLCWAPYHVIGVLDLLATPCTEFHEMLRPWDHVSIALAYANSCINPLVYVFVGKKFRDRARQTVQRIFEEAFSEEGTCSTACSQDRSKTSVVKDTDVSVL